MATETIPPGGKTKSEIAEAFTQFAKEKTETQTPGVSVMDKFAARETPEGIKRGAAAVKTEVDPPEQKSGEEAGSQPKEQKPTEQAKEKKPSFTKEKIAEAEAAKQRAEALEKEKGDLTTKIADLEKQLSEAGSKKEFNDLLSQRDTAIKEKEGVIEELNSKLKERDDKLSLYDLQNNEAFRRDYVMPIQETTARAQNLLGGDEALQKLFMEAGQLNAAALHAKNPEDRSQVERMRGEKISEIASQLPNFDATRFERLMEDIIILTEKHHEKITKHAETYQEYQRSTKEAQERALQETQKQWRSAYDEAATSVADRVKADPVLTKYMESNGITADTVSDEAIAQAALNPAETKYGPKDIGKILNQGAKFGTVLAQRDAALKLIAEQEQTIRELRGQSPSGSNGSQRDSKTEGGEFEEKKNAFFQKFSATRAR